MTKDEELLAHLVRYCFGAVYIAELLISVYGFNISTWKNIIFQQNVRIFFFQISKPFKNFIIIIIKVQQLISL